MEDEFGLEGARERDLERDQYEEDTAKSETI